jgi:hypothetical protein
MIKKTFISASLVKKILTSIAILFIVNSTQVLVVQSQQSNTSKIRFVEPALERQPDNRGAPRDRKGAGTRGDCPAINTPLTALVPLVSKTASQKQATAPYVLGLTTSEHPTFWFYVPYSAKNINSVKFVLLDEKNNSVTKEPIALTLPKTPGVISVTLPTTEKPLVVGQYYHWYLLIDCNPQSRSEDLAVEGLVQRITLNKDLASRLQAATPRQRVALYARAGIWQDAITTLGELKRAKPQDPALAADWKDLLESVGLADVASMEIVE